MMNRWPIRVLAWAGFWLMVYWFGMVQAWEFSDIPPKPPLVTILGPIGFWAPMIYVFGPILQFDKQAGSMLWLAIGAWSTILAVAIVAVENALLARFKGRAGWSALVGTVVTLSLVRLVTIVLPATHDSVVMYLLSSVVLLAIVAIAWVSLILLPFLALVPRLRQRMFAGSAVL